jgi:PQQ-like domain
VRWIRPVPGSWAVQDGEAGTTPSVGQAYAALDSQVVAVGSGLSVSAYQAGTGHRLWTTVLTGFPAGSVITAVRVWPGMVTVGVVPPAASAGSAHGGTADGGPPREEVLLRAATGHQVRAYPAAQFGGAVAASPAATIIVGPHAVTSYANRTGAVWWSRPTGADPQAWQVDSTDLYMAVAAGGYLGSAPVTALRRINLNTGAQRLIRPGGPSFPGALSLAYRGVVVFSSDRWARAYSGTTGHELWRYPGALPDTFDAVTGRLYLISGNTLIGVNPQTGATLARVTAASSSGLYGVREGAVLGIDHGALGKAWAYDIAAQQVRWTSRPLPWPHYFVDLSGIGGSAPPAQDAVLLAICGQVAAQPPGTGAPRCTRPELAVLNR